MRLTFAYGGVMNDTSFQPERRLALTAGRYHRLLQVIGAIPLEGLAGSARFEAARSIALDWLGVKKKIALGGDAIGGESWDFEASDSTRALNIEASPGLWAFRFDDPDGRDSAQLWRVELVLTHSDDDVPPLMGCTLSVMVPPGSIAEVTPSVPAIVTRIANELGLFDDNRRLAGSAMEVDRDAELDQLFKLIESPSRSSAVVVVASEEDGSSFADANKIARDLAGLAHVVCVSHEASWEITRRYGKALSVFGDAVRVYRAGFDPDSDTPYRHPLFLARSWRERVFEMLSRIRFDAIADTVARPSEANDIPSFAIIRRAAADRRLRAAAAMRPAPEDTQGVSRRELEVERAIAQLTASAKSWEDAALEEDQRRQIAEKDLRDAQARLWAQQQRISYLEQRFAELSVVDEPTWPETFDDLIEWSERYVAGRVVITKRAVRAAQQSVFLDVPSVYRALHYLATSYWRMRTEGGAVLEAAAREAEMEIGVKRSGTGDAAHDRRYEAEYRVRYESDEYILDQHLVGSNSRGEQRCLRIYFVWDEDRRIVIVGHFPTHLTNRLT